MDVMEAIQTRRSIRKYTNEPVSQEIVQELLKAAMMAPSAGNQQPWHFIVVTDRDLMESLTTVHPYAAMAPKAPMGILVCGDIKLEKFSGFWPQDCSAAIQNLLLAAHGKGLGAVWTGIYPLMERVDRCREIFGLADHVTPLAYVVIGYPAEQPKTVDRFKAERIHRNQWSH